MPACTSACEEEEGSTRLPFDILPAQHPQRDVGIQQICQHMEDIAGFRHLPRHKQRGHLIFGCHLAVHISSSLITSSS